MISPQYVDGLELRIKELVEKGRALETERDQLAQLVPLLNDFLHGELIDDINRDDNGFFGPCYEDARVYQRKVATQIVRVLDAVDKLVKEALL